MPSTSPQDLLEECFFSGKNHTLVYHSQTLSENVRLIGEYVSAELSELYSTSQTEHVEWQFFSKWKFSKLFSRLWLENVRILFASYRQFYQNCLYVSIGMIWGNEKISETDVILLGVHLKTFELSMDLFPQVCQNNIQSVQRKSLRGYFFGISF